jgi:two-component system response regulator DesR
VIRILLGQRVRLVRDALAAVVAAQEDLHVVGDVADTDDAVPLVQQHRPDVTVLDADLPGSVAIATLCQELPQARPPTGVLVLLDPQAHGRLGRDLAELVPRVGLLATAASSGEFVSAIRRVAAGEAVLDAQLAAAALRAGHNPLSEREREVLRLAVAGAPISEIAKVLGLQPGTIRNYLTRIVTRTGGRTRFDAMRIAEQAGWL